MNQATIQRPNRGALAATAILLGAALVLVPALVTTPPARAAGAAVSIRDLAFRPSQLTVYVGDTVTWTNDDVVEHTVTSLGAGARPTPTPSPTAPASVPPTPTPGDLFDFTLAPGESVSFTFDQSGNYDYFCRNHPEMTGVIGVRIATLPSPTPSGQLPDAAAAGARTPASGLLISLGLLLMLIGSLGTLVRRRPA